MKDQQQTDASTLSPTNASKNDIGTVLSSESTQPSSSSPVVTKCHQKKNRQGRRGRRKRIKAAEIEKAAELAAAAAATDTSSAIATTTISTKSVLNDTSMSTTTSTSSSTTSMIPTDRNYILPAVEELSQISESQKLELSKQLGYIPGNALRVVAAANKIYATPSSSDDNDYESESSRSIEEPLVLELYPLALRNETDGKKGRQRKRKKSITSKIEHKNEDDTNDGNCSSHHNNSMLIEPFPTIYWLTHVHIRALVSKLELDRWCPKLELRLKNDHEARESMQLAHQEYALKRHQLLSQQDQIYIKNRGWDKRVFSIDQKCVVGIAGIRNFDCIKCLHAHAAHYLSGCNKNVVGLWVVEEVQRMIRKKTTSATTKDAADNSTEIKQTTAPI